MLTALKIIIDRLFSKKIFSFKLSTTFSILILGRITSTLIQDSIY